VGATEGGPRVVATTKAGVRADVGDGRSNHSRHLYGRWRNSLLHGRSSSGILTGVVLVLLAADALSS
jgi:hypothetical protein